jgi:hypothetical protein
MTGVGLDSDSGQRGSPSDLLERIAAAVAGNGGLAVDQRPPELRRRAVEALERTPALGIGGAGDRSGLLFGVHELGVAWGERGGNEIPHDGAYAGPR